MDKPFDSLIPFKMLYGIAGKQVIVGKFFDENFCYCKVATIIDIQEYHRESVFGNSSTGLRISWRSEDGEIDHNSFWDTKWNDGERFAGLTGILWANEQMVNLSNKDRKTCFKCNCTTEKRRDFSDMSVREFCPRCKI